MNGFYYNGLPREEKAAYEQMKAGFETLASTVRVVRLEQKRLAEVYAAFEEVNASVLGGENGAETAATGEEV